MKRGTTTILLFILLIFTQPNLGIPGPGPSLDQDKKEEIKFEQIVLDAHFPKKVRKVKESLGRVMLEGTNARGDITQIGATCFRIGPNHLLTAYHFLQPKEEEKEIEQRVNFNKLEVFPFKNGLHGYPSKLEDVDAKRDINSKYDLVVLKVDNIQDFGPPLELKKALPILKYSHNDNFYLYGFRGGPAIVFSPVKLAGSLLYEDETDMEVPLYQTDIVIGPGFSGAPVLNKEGKVIGVIVAAIERAYSLFVPINDEILTWLAPIIKLRPSNPQK